MDELKPTPRNKLLGLIADNLREGLDFATYKGQNKPMNMLAELLALPAIQKTADRLSYGEPLTTGKGFTTRLQPETFDAAMGVLPFAGSMGRGANYAAEGLNKGAAMIGKAAAPSTERLVNAVMAKGGLPAQLMQDMAQGTKSPAIVWHGSPHKFDAFDASKIGTGEGAQAYGHGLYLAESPDVADSYRKALTYSDDYVNGQLLDSSNPEHFLARILGDESGNVGAAKESLLVLSRPGGSKSVADSAKQALQLLESGQRPTLQTIKPEGSLYKVDLPDEHIAKMLDWDKPLSQQAPHIQDFFQPMKKEGIDVVGERNKIYDLYDAKKISLQDRNKMIGELGQNNLKDTHRGETLYQMAAGEYGGMANAANALREAGIPGVRYLDQGSRGAGQGSSNYVVFPGNERLLKILERNGESVAPKTKFEYPVGDRDILAQQRAALPISENGLGLPANNTAMDRARAMDWNQPAYTGVNTIGEIDNMLPKSWFSEQPKYASDYANVLPKTGIEGDPRVYPVLLNTGKVKSQKYTGLYEDMEKALSKKKTDTFKVENVGGGENNFYVTKDPNQIRSRFAAFDPWRRNAAIAAAMGVAAPDLLAKDNNELASILKSRK